jgi:hypothetical protein
MKVQGPGEGSPRLAAEPDEPCDLFGRNGPAAVAEEMARLEKR